MKSSEHGKFRFATFSLFRKSACWFFAPVTDFRAFIPSIPWKPADFSHQNFHQSVSKNFMKNQQSRSKPTYSKHIRHYRTIIYINIHYFFVRLFTEPCSNDYAECERGPRNAEPKFAECSKIPPRRAVRWQVSTAHIAYAPTLSRRQGRGVLFDPVMPYPVVSCRICTFYIKFRKSEQFKPYSVSFDVFYSNLKYSHTILTRSVKNRLSCRWAGGWPGLIRRRHWILPNSGILA